MENPQNIELSQCVKAVSNFGNTTYENICTGASQTVGWGAADWALAVFWILFSLAGLFFLFGFIFLIVFDR